MMIDYELLSASIGAGVVSGGITLMLIRSLIDFSTKLIIKLLALYKVKKFQKNLNEIKKEGNNDVFY